MSLACKEINERWKYSSDWAKLRDSVLSDMRYESVPRGWQLIATLEGSEYRSACYVRSYADIDRRIELEFADAVASHALGRNNPVTNNPAGGFIVPATM